MAQELYTHEQIQRELEQLPGWTLKDGKLHREFTFKNFSEAFAFMARAALYSEKADHHPEWTNVYNRLTIDLMSHDAKGITRRDIAWAREVCSYIAGS